ncbi:MAG: hypothetical protein COA63_005120 [Methylophaga sp.]|nr:hypothetical protein [Methylophaga sp.]
MYSEHLQKFIPPEFDLAKYEKSANIELIYWVDNLIKRAKPLSCFLNSDHEFTVYKCNSESESESDKGFYDFVSDGLDERELFERDVRLNILSGTFVDENIHNLVQAMFIDETSHAVSIISEMNYADLISLDEKNITKEKRELFSTVEQSRFPSDLEKNLGELNNPIYSYSVNGEIDLSWLKVDMSCSDSEISTAFNDWLKQHREKEESLIKTKRRMHKLKKINKTAFRKWHDAKVLAYIDLVTWNFLNKQKITSINLGEILFPDPRIISDKAKMIDDTTKPYAERLTSNRFIRRVGKIVVDEKRKKIS